jgi:hypothetical protein
LATPAGELARHLAWYLPPFALAQLLGIWLAPHKAAGQALIVVAAFLQAYLARFGAAVGLLVALLVLPVPTGAVIRTGLHGYLQALSSFAADLGTHLADPDTDVRLRGDSRALDHALFQTGLVVGHLVPHSARRQCTDALLDRLPEGARQVRTIVRHVSPSPSRPGVTTTVRPLIETLTTTIAALDRRVDASGLPELISSGKHVHSSGKHVHNQRSRLTADDADLARTLTALHDLDRCLISIRAGGPI